MNFKKLARGLSVLTLVSLLLVPAVDANSVTQDVPNVALLTASEYFDSFISNDIEGQIENSIDTNYLNDETRREGYQNFPNTDLTGYKILSAKKINDSLIDLSVQYIYPGINDYPALPYSVIKEDGAWKVEIKPLEVNLDKTSVDYRKVKEGLPLYAASFTKPANDMMQISSVMLDYYSFSGLTTSPLVGYDTFNIASGNTSVTINGWQYSNEAIPNYGSVKYEIISIAGGITNWYGQKTVNGDYVTSYYAEFIYLSQAPISNARIRISAMNGASHEGAGNIYANH